MLKQCVTYFISLILGSFLVYSLTALAIAPIKPEVASNSRLEGVISKLITCESGGRIDAVHYNDGAPGLHSRGILQFQRPTFKLYWLKLINKDIEDKEIDNLWTDPEAQKQLAAEMLKDDQKNLHNWEICTRRFNLMSELSAAPNAKNSISN